MPTWLPWIMLIMVVAAFLWVRGGNTNGLEARRLVAEGALLLDVRSIGEFQAGHLDGAVHVPLHELEQRSRELGPPERPIVVYCQSGVRSAQALRTLTRHGFQRVYNLGGLSNW
ncbi:MAG: rhodanese-like domain-containing protein [Bradymonadia bacterium]|jgi:phage shock protein E